MIEVLVYDPRATLDMMGIVPSFLSEHDPRPAKEQFNDRYSFGGGWTPIKDFKLNKDLSIKYPGDTVLRPLIGLQFRDEKIIMYPYAIFMILQKDQSFEISRMD